MSSDDLVFEFEIEKADGNGTFSLANVQFGEEIVPVLTSTTNGILGVTYRHSIDDYNYNEGLPTDVGTYFVVAIFVESNNYKSFEIKTDAFKITKKIGRAHV